MLPDVQMNYWAVLVAALGNMVLGGLWYSPLLFGKQWMHLMGWSQSDMGKHKGEAARGYFISTLTALLTAYVMARLVRYTNSTTSSLGGQTGLLAWLGFVAPVLLGSVLWEGKKFALYLINAGYYLVSLVGMGMLLAVWL